MLPFELSASSKGLAHLPMELHEGEFNFHVGSMTYKTNVIIAEFLSPKICAIRTSDPTVSEYTLDVHDPNMMFKDFMSLALGEGVKVDSENFDFLVSVSRDLENKELVTKLVSRYLSVTELSVSNAVRFLRTKGISDGSTEQEIAFIARNFHEIEDLASLEIHYLRQVLGHPSLRIRSEDALYDFVCALMKKDPSFSELLEFVLFKFLSKDSIQHFIRTSSGYIFEHLNDSIWKSLCDRLSELPMLGPDACEKQESRYGSIICDLFEENTVGRISALEEEIAVLRMENEKQRQRINDLLFPAINYNGNAFNGIVAELTRKCGGNPDKKGVIAVNVSSNNNSSKHPHQILDYDWNSYFVTKDAPNSWIELDLKDRKVSLRHYTLKSASVSYHFFTSWVIEGSNDHIEWDVIDARNTKDLSGSSIVKTYEVQRPGTCYRYIRMRQTGKNTSDQDYLLLSNFEMFGQVVQEDI